MACTCTCHPHDETSKHELGCCGCCPADEQTAEVLHLPTKSPPAEPNDDDIAGVRYGDLKALDARVTAAETAVEDYRGGIAAIAAALHIDPDGMTPVDLVGEIAMVARGLVATQHLVDEAAKEMKQLITAGDGPEINLGGGRKMKLVGRRLPDVIADSIPGMPKGRGYPTQLERGGPT